MLFGQRLAIGLVNYVDAYVNEEVELATTVGALERQLNMIRRTFDGDPDVAALAAPGQIYEVVEDTLHLKMDNFKRLCQALRTLHF